MEGDEIETEIEKYENYNILDIIYKVFKVAKLISNIML